MTIGDILTLDYSDKYLLLDKIVANNEDYFLAIGVNKDETDINPDDISYFKEVDEDGATYVEEVTDPSILEELFDATDKHNLKKLDEIETALEDYYNN